MRPRAAGKWIALVESCDDEAELERALDLDIAGLIGTPTNVSAT